MKIKILFLFILLNVSASVFGQNKLDAKGKKDGKWTVYLDANWKEIKDSSKAVYYRYTIYDQGTNLYPMGSCGGKGWKLESINNSKSKLLDGDYKWFNKQGQLSSTHSFKSGEYIDCKEYYSNGKIEQHFAYAKKYKNEPNTYCFYQYDKNGNPNFFVWRKGKLGWMFYQCSEDDIK